MWGDTNVTCFVNLCLCINDISRIALNCLFCTAIYVGLTPLSLLLSTCAFASMRSRSTSTCPFYAAMVCWDATIIHYLVNLCVCINEQSESIDLSFMHCDVCWYFTTVVRIVNLCLRLNEKSEYVDLPLWKLRTRRSDNK